MFTMPGITPTEALYYVQSRALGHLGSSMLSAAFALDVFEKMEAAGPVSLEQAGVLWGLPAPSARVLAQFLCNMGLLRYENDALQNAPAISVYLTVDREAQGSTNYMCRLGPDPDDVVGLLRNPPPQHWYQIRSGERSVSDEAGMNGPRMHRRRMHWGEALAAQWDFSGYHRLLDIAGASGGWCIGLRRRFPDLQCTVFDLPDACTAAAELLEEHPEGKELTYVAGDLFADDLPQGADVALLANILHDWSPKDGSLILGKAHDALTAGGTLLIKEYFYADDWTNPVGEASRQALEVLGHGDQSGWQPSYREMEELLREQGFTPTGRHDEMVVATKT